MKPCMTFVEEKVLPQLVMMLEEKRSEPEVPDPAYPIFVIACEQFQNDPLRQKESLKLIGMVLEISPTPELAYACAEFYNRYGFRDKAEQAYALGVKLKGRSAPNIEKNDKSQ